VRLALHDHLELRYAADPDGPDELEVRGDTGVPPADDLVLRATARLREAAGRPVPAVRFRLDKDIPVAAGLGGGSADAAAALELAAGTWDLDLSDARFAGIAARLGADVPFCLARVGAARVGGVGEVVSSLSAPSTPAGVLLVTAGPRLSTAAVFAELDRQRASGGDAIEVGSAAADTSHPTHAGAAVARLASALDGGADAASLAGHAADLRDANELWPAASALLPMLGPLRHALEEALQRPCLLSGSGPTLVALYPSAQEAARAASRLSQAPPRQARGARIIATTTSA